MHKAILAIICALILCAGTAFGTLKHYGDVPLSGGSQSGHFDDIWDLTLGDMTITFTYEGYGLVDDFGGAAHAWAELGVRAVGYGDFNPTWMTGGAGVWLATDYEWSANTFDPDPPGAPIQDLDDKLILQRGGGMGEGSYDLPSAPPNPWANFGVWFDRDGVDPSQAQMWGAIDGVTYNTGGTYDVVITLHATSPTSGTAYMTVNGVDQGFYVPDWHPGPPDLYPAGMNFTGDMTQMQVFYGLYGDGATHSVEFRDITATTPPEEVWVDDDYYNGGYNDGHTWGYDAFDNIQDGIDAVAGSKVNVMGGTYTQNVIIAKSLDLVGAGSATTTIDGNNVGNTVTITASDVKLSGFRVTGGWQVGGHPEADVFYPDGGVVVDGNGGASALTGITIEDNVIDGNSGNGVYVSAAGHGGTANNLIIKDCEIFNNGGSMNYAGISLTHPNYILRPVGVWDEWRRPKNILVQGNTIHSNDNYGLYVSAGENIVIKLNEIWDNSKYGLQLASSWNRADIPCEYTSVKKNEIHHNARNGVKLTSYNQHNTFTKNEIYNNGYSGSKDYYKYGFLFQDGNDNTLEKNTITGNALGGLYLWGKGDPSYTWYSTTNNTITRNTISNHTATNAEGMYAPPQSGNPNSGFLNSTISKNKVENCGDNGIHLEDVEHITISRNEVENCGDNGIHLEDVEHITISRNEVENCGGDGIYLKDSDDNIVFKNEVKKGGGDGIRLESADHNAVVVNTCEENGGYGFYVDGASDNNDILRNKAKKNTLGPFFDGGGSGNTWVGNSWQGGAGPMLAHRHGTPLVFSLAETSPNPVKETAAISFQLAAPSHTTLKVYDVTGRIVEILVDEELTPGVYSATWNRKETASGVYFYRLSSNGKTLTRKMTVIR